MLLIFSSACYKEESEGYFRDAHIQAIECTSNAQCCQMYSSSKSEDLITSRSITDNANYCCVMINRLNYDTAKAAAYTIDTLSTVQL